MKKNNLSQLQAFTIVKNYVKEFPDY